MPELYGWIVPHFEAYVGGNPSVAEQCVAMGSSRPVPWGLLECLVHQWLSMSFLAMITPLHNPGFTIFNLLCHLSSMHLLWMVSSFMPKPPWSLKSMTLSNLSSWNSWFWLWPSQRKFLLIWSSLEPCWDKKQRYQIGGYALILLSTLLIRVNLPPMERYCCFQQEVFSSNLSITPF